MTTPQHIIDQIDACNATDGAKAVAKKVAEALGGDWADWDVAPQPPPDDLFDPSPWVHINVERPGLCLSLTCQQVGSVYGTFNGAISATLADLPDKLEQIRRWGAQ